MKLGEPRGCRRATRVLVEGAAHRLNRHPTRPDPRGLFQAGGRPARSARSMISRSIRYVIMKATAATGSTRNGARRCV
jgi:hypothetical protein